jgi:DNA-binding response OmpR family regulator
MNVLVVGADSDLVDLLGYTLWRAGHTMLTAQDSDRALRSLEAEHPDIVLLDVALPRVEGLEICRRLRQRARTPVILLAERSAEADILRGFESGADDYVAKPFSAKQLLARMEAVLRRYENDPARLVSKELCVGELVFDPETHCVIKAGRPSKSVTRLEFSLLYHLALNAGQVVPYARLIEAAWGYYDEDSATLLKTHVSHLRRKLGLPQQGPCSIRAVPRMGYRLATT